MAAKSKITKKVLQKLEMAFGFGCTDPEACQFADIPLIVFQQWVKDNPNFEDRKDALKLKPALAARHAVVKAIIGDKERGIPPDTGLAMKYLERKCKSEFGGMPDEADSLKFPDIKITVIHNVQPKQSD